MWHAFYPSSCAPQSGDKETGLINEYYRFRDRVVAAIGWVMLYGIGYLAYLYWSE